MKLTGYENFIGYMQLPENITNKIRTTDDLPTVAKEISDEVLKVVDYVNILTDYYSDIIDDTIIRNAGLNLDMHELSKRIPDALPLLGSVLGRDIVQLCELFADDDLNENTSMRALYKKVSDLYAKSVEVVGEDHDIPVGLQSLLVEIEEALIYLQKSAYNEFEAGVYAYGMMEGKHLSGIIYGYIRVSTKKQNEDRQMIALREVGVPEKNIVGVFWFR